MSGPPAVTSRPSSGPADLDAIAEMTAATPDALHRIDLPWRLASPAAHDPTLTRLWEAPAGTLRAWAILQTPWHCLDFEVRAGPHRAALTAAVLDWATARLDVEAANRGADLPFYVSARDDDAVRLAAIQGAGFASAGWSYIHLTRALPATGSVPVLPAGFVIRALQPAHEIDAYVATHRAAFGSTNMRADWRQRTTESRSYTPELDLVVVVPGGAVAAFGVGWITPRELSGTGGRRAHIEPLGVLPAYQRQGLGRAVLHEVFRRAAALGCTSIDVDAESTNLASQAAYAALGFQPAFEAPFARRIFGQG